MLVSYARIEEISLECLRMVLQFHISFCLLIVVSTVQALWAMPSLKTHNPIAIEFCQKNKHVMRLKIS